jgi:ubiquinone/menaquinone biosynthesis C-methylase UbiE
METHPEQYSEGARLSIRKRIHETYSRIGHDLYELGRVLLDLRPSDEVLDVGCGLGDFLLNLRERGHLGRLVGVDQSAEVIDEARRAAFRLGYWVEYRVGEAAMLDFQAASFNCVTALHVLGQTDPGRVLAEMGRVLRADGRIVVSTNSRTCYPLLEELKARARERFGWFLATEWTEGFESESAPEILRRYFREVEEFRYDDVLQYPDAEVLVDLFRSNRGLWSERLTAAEWERIVDWARDEALELIPEHGYAEDAKSFSLFRCAMPLGL